MVLSDVTSNGKTGVIIVLNSETDFVAKNAEFVGFANKILALALDKQPADLDQLKALSMEGTTVGEKVVEHIGIIGEKLDLSYYGKVDAPHVQAYVHPGNRLATLVGFNKAGVDSQVYKDIAMQVAAMAPVAIDKDNVPQKIIDQELEIGREQARLDGKPEAMLDKIAQGKLGKFFKENTLLNQDFIKENKQTVAQFLKSKDKISLQISRDLMKVKADKLSVSFGNAFFIYNLVTLQTMYLILRVEQVVLWEQETNNYIFHFNTLN